MRHQFLLPSSVSLGQCLSTLPAGHSLCLPHFRQGLCITSVNQLAQSLGQGNSQTHILSICTVLIAVAALSAVLAAMPSYIAIALIRTVHGPRIQQVSATVPASSLGWRTAEV
jgi:hypothetical protein